MTAQLQDKVAIVTGGGGGIGKRIAREFAKAGADVVVASRSLAKLEPIPQDVLESCFEHARQADAILLLGTSATVTPAADFPVMVYRQGGRLIEINPQETPLSQHCSAVLRAPTGETLPKLVGRVAEFVG